MTDYGITVQNLLQKFPLAFSADKSLGALAEAIAKELVRREAETGLGTLYPNIDALPERVLDILAYDFKVDWWDTSYTLEQKRQTLKDSWRVHRTLGTKAAVETAISAIYPNTRVLEWFDYAGDPFYFRLHINAAGLRTDTENYEQVLRRVNYYKSVRSHLDGFIWDYSGEPFVNEPDQLRLHQFIVSMMFSDRRNEPLALFDGQRIFDGSFPFGTEMRSMFAFPAFTVNATMPGVRDALELAGIQWGGITFENEQTLTLPHFRASFPAFSNERNRPTVLFDGARLFSGRDLFGQTQAAMFAFPQFAARAELRELQERITAAFGNRLTFREWPGRRSARFDGRTLFDGFAQFGQASGGFMQLDSFRMATAIAHREKSNVERVVVAAGLPKMRESIRGTVTINNWHTFGGEDTFSGSRRFDAEIKQEEL